MSPRLPSEIFGRRFRLNPAFRIVPADQLSPDDLERLGGLRNDGEVQAVLMPTVPLLSAKAICRQTAALLDSFRLPAFPRPYSGDVIGAEETLLLRLVLDSVLEIEHEGHFLHGPSAREALQIAPLDEFVDERPPARLSLEALRYAEALEMSEPLTLSAKLYGYNRVPISPRWVERVGTPEGMASWIGLETNSPLWTHVRNGWFEAPPSLDNPGWRYFRSEHQIRGASFKLYVNPRLDCFREAIEAALPVFLDMGFTAFKVGRHLQNLLRPDKFVAYASTQDQINSAARALLLKIRGMPAQGVPFTSAIDDDGLLSWGVDPPRIERVSCYQGTSWRRWVTDKLAVALVAARAGRAEAPVRFALQRAALEGIDVNSWTPVSVPWAQIAKR